MRSDRGLAQEADSLVAKPFAELRSDRLTRGRANGGEGEAMSTAELIDAEIGRLAGQRDEALARAEDFDRKLEEMDKRRIALAPPAFTGDEEADRELLTLEESAGRLSQKARMARNAASELGRLVEEAEARRAKEERRVHLGRHVGLSEERYRLEVELEEAMGGVLEGLERLRKLDADQHAEARAAGLGMEERYRSLVAGWLSSRLRGYLPLGEVDEAYWEPLFDADEQNLEPGEKDRRGARRSVRTGARPARASRGHGKRKG
jgi:hypothetical protein